MTVTRTTTTLAPPPPPPPPPPPSWPQSVAATAPAGGPALTISPTRQPSIEFGGSDLTTWLKHPLTVGVATIVIAGAAYLGLHHHSAHRLSGADLAIDVEQTIQEQTGYHVTATCDDVPDLKKGAIADCEVFTSDGSTIETRVTFDDSAGHFHIQS